MDARRVITRGVSTGLRLSRGTADRVITVAGPRLGRLTDKAVARLRRTPPPAATTTFTPSRRPETETAPEAEPTSAEPQVGRPSPASVARNIGPPRPTAAPPRATQPKSVPGAKLPPRRPATS